MTTTTPPPRDIKPRIVVIGVGGGGGNAVNNMIAGGLSGPKFVVANTDAQALSVSSAEHRVQLGARLTEGIGAGAKHEIGEAAAEEALEEIRAQLAGAHMVFVAAGMGGGTGTGAAPVIARVAKEFGILTVAVVTKPFLFEGKRRMAVAEVGIAELKRHVDTLLVIPNQNLFKVTTERTAFAEAFALADQVLYSGVACIVDLVVKDGLINLDLADVKTVLSGMGTAMMGTGEASGEQRAVAAAREAIFNPLLEDVKLRGAKSLLLSISGGSDLTLFEVHDAVDCVRQEVDGDANIIFGATLDESLTGRIRVSIVASGMPRSQQDMAVADARAGQAKPPSGSQQPPSAGTGAGPQGFRDRLSRAIDGTLPADVEREEWRAHGDVVIREGLPQLPGHPQPARRGGQLSSASTHAGGRPMPAVQDFPEVGQREYWAKGGGDRGADQPPVHRQPDPPPRRPSLLQRLTGAGRDKRAEVTQAEQRGAGGGPVSQRPDEEFDLPVFFGRDQRK
jgi:cell division protein FtsZ